MLLLLLLLLLLVLLLLPLVSDEERESEREVLPTGLQSRHVVGSVGSGWLIDLVKSHRFFMHRMNMRERRNFINE